MGTAQRASIVAAAALMIGGQRVTAAAEQSRLLVMVVDDRAQVAPAVLDLAAKEAARILLHAGVGVEWRAAAKAGIAPAPGADHTSRPGAFLIQLVVLPKFPGTPAPRSRLLMGATLGTSRACGGVVYAFHQEVIELADLQRITPWLALGSVVAHEIGHALLRNRGHTAEGLMRAPWAAADWERAGLGLLLFSPDETAAIHTTMAVCHANH
jgi:hypothetical protein